MCVCVLVVVATALVEREGWVSDVFFGLGFGFLGKGGAVLAGGLLFLVLVV